MFSELLSEDGRIRVADEGPYPIYSRIDWQTGDNDQQLTFFSYTQDQEVSASNNAPSRQASLLDTNVEREGQMAEQEGMLVTSDRIEVNELQVAEDGTETFVGQEPQCSPFNMSLFGFALIYELRVSSKPYEQMTPLFYPTGYGVFNMWTTTAATIQAANNGMPTQEAARYMPRPHVILPGEKFLGVLRNPPGTAMGWLNPATGEAAQTQLRIKNVLDGNRVRDVSAYAPDQIPPEVLARPIIIPVNMVPGG